MATKLQYSEIPKGELKDILDKDFNSETAFTYVTVKDFVMPVHYKTMGDDILNMAMKEDDVVISTFPKCGNNVHRVDYFATGTTWSQEMVWCVANDLNFDVAKKILLQERFPFLEHSSLFDFEGMKAKGEVVPDYLLDSFGYTKRLQGRRFIKTHLPLELLPLQIQGPDRKAKLIYVSRDPRDVVVSFFHHCVLLHGFTGDLETFMKVFTGDSVMYAPFWRHILQFWAIRDQPNLLFLTYEEMKKDLPSVLRRVADFLGKSLTDDQVAALTDHLSFDSMKKNKAVNMEHYTELSDKAGLGDGTGAFMRLGQSGGFLKTLNKSQIKQMDEWNRKHLKGTDFVLPEYNY